MVMVANKKSQDQMTEDLSLFLGNNTIRFTVWYVSEYLCLRAKSELVFCIGGVLRSLVRFTVKRHSVGCAAQASGGFSICQWNSKSPALRTCEDNFAGASVFTDTPAPKELLLLCVRGFVLLPSTRRHPLPSPPPHTPQHNHLQAVSSAFWARLPFGFHGNNLFPFCFKLTIPDTCMSSFEKHLGHLYSLKFQISNLFFHIKYLWFELPFIKLHAPLVENKHRIQFKKPSFSYQA